MRALLSASLLVAGPLAGEPAFAQAGTPAGKSAQQVKEIDERVAEWLKTCLADWDKSTHMSKSEWRTTCHRVSSERRKFLIEDLKPIDAPRR